MLTKILSPMPPESLKVAGLQGVLHMSPVLPVLQNNSAQDAQGATPNPTPALLTVDTLSQIKRALQLQEQREQQASEVLFFNFVSFFFANGVFIFELLFSCDLFPTAPKVISGFGGTVAKGEYLEDQSGRNQYSCLKPATSDLQANKQQSGI